MTAVLAAMLWALGCARSAADAPMPTVPVAVPAARAAPGLHELTTEPPKRTLRVMIDAGHGAKGNTGNTSVACESEADFTRRVQDNTLVWLGARPGLELRAGRPSAAAVEYGDRITDMEAWPADAVVSLHSDARAALDEKLDPATGCWGARGQTGFAILYGDEGAPALAAARRRLGEELSASMREAGFLSYGGEDYPGLYDRVSDGVFVDRHAVGKRIRMLRGTHVPLVIVETHQALDRDDVALWNQAITQVAFASAVYRAAVRAAAGS